MRSAESTWRSCGLKCEYPGTKSADSRQSNFLFVPSTSPVCDHVPGSPVRGLGGHTAAGRQLRPSDWLGLGRPDNARLLGYAAERWQTHRVSLSSVKAPVVIFHNVISVTNNILDVNKVTIIRYRSLMSTWWCHSDLWPSVSNQIIVSGCLCQI